MAARVTSVEGEVFVVPTTGAVRVTAVGAEVFLDLTPAVTSTTAGSATGTGTASGVTAVNLTLTTGSATGTGTASAQMGGTFVAAGTASGVGAASGGLFQTGTVSFYGVAVGQGATSAITNFSATGTIQTAGQAAGTGAASANVVRKFESSISETVGVRSGYTIARVVLLLETVRPSAASTYVSRPGAIMSETAGIQESPTTALKYPRSLTETVTASKALTIARPVSMSETANTTASLAAVRGVTLLETLGVVGILSARASYRPSLVETILTTPALSRFLGASLAETLSVTGVQSPAWRFARGMSETTNISAAISRQLIFRVVAADGVHVSEASLRNMIFRPTMSERLEVNILHWSPNGGITTWAVNTLTGATTEYSNYEFNSFARIGRKYIGASASGLYELDGDTDAGTSIISRIKGGYTQFGGSRFTAFAGAYLGLRGNGNFTFRLVTGDGKTYDYLVKSHTMRTTKVNMGKGLRARYFSYELISAGQDFDLDSVEFLLMVAQRRV